MEKLRRVELATLYVELLKEVEDLTVEARKHLPADPKEALIPYTRLKELALRLRDLQEPAEGAAPHLVQYVDDTCTSLWLQMKKIMSDEFESVLQKADWPEEAKEPTREWTDCFDRLLDLQGPEIIAARAPLILLPMGVLAKPFVQEFKYHFFSDKPTNSPQRVSPILQLVHATDLQLLNEFRSMRLTACSSATISSNISLGLSENGSLFCVRTLQQS
jgi:hypothetical protein